MIEFEGLIPIRDWFSEFRENHLIISGPCSAESKKQLSDTAVELKKLNRVHVFRAGVWKPRTRPGTFEGVGKKGLKWLSEIKQDTGMRIATEVAAPRHLELALSYGIDLIWIGARTISNPFSVQALADIMKNTEIPVLVKNPTNPDLSLWIGALERFYEAGVRKLAAVHRGFYPFEPTNLRNIPKWEIPLELKTNYHNLPILSDPSHIAGKPEYIFDIAQKALDLGMSGLMIECHIDPTQALSDPQQQIPPQQLEDVLDKLIFRNFESSNLQIQDKLETLRENIDSIDEQILELLAQRLKIVEEIGKYKNKNKLTIFQLRRWEKILSSRVSRGMKLGMSERFIKNLLQLVHKESIRKQTLIMNKQKDENSEMQ